MSQFSWFLKQRHKTEPHRPVCTLSVLLVAILLVSASTFFGPRVHARSIAPRIAAQEQPAQRMKFSANRFAAVVNGSLYVWNTTSWNVVVQRTFGGTVLSMADGSIVAFDNEGTYRLPANKNTFEPHARHYAAKRYFADPAHGQQAWFVSARYVANNSLTPSSAQWPKLNRGFPIDPWINGDVVLLSDGSLVLSNNHRKLHHIVDRSNKTTFSVVPSGLYVWRLLPGPEAGQVWVVSKTGEFGVATLPTVQTGARFDTRFKSSAPPYDVDSNGSLVAATLILDPSRPGAFKLTVFDAHGMPRLNVTPYTAPCKTRRCIDRHNMKVTLSVHAPLVAVGGDERVAVWDHAKGKLVMSFEGK